MLSWEVIEWNFTIVKEQLQLDTRRTAPTRARSCYSIEYQGQCKGHKSVTWRVYFPYVVFVLQVPILQERLLLHWLRYPWCFATWTLGIPASVWSTQSSCTASPASIGVSTTKPLREPPSTMSEYTVENISVPTRRHHSTFVYFLLWKTRLAVNALRNYCNAFIPLQILATEPQSTWNLYYALLYRYFQDTKKTQYRGADKFLARPGRKQANVSARMACISFSALPWRGEKKLDDSSRLNVPDMLPSLFPSWSG